MPRPLNSGMLNSPDDYRTFCTGYTSTYPYSYNKNGPRPSSCGVRFLLHFYFDLLIDRIPTIWYVSYSQGAPTSSHNTAAKSEQFL